MVAPPFQLLGLARTTPSIHAAEYVLHVLLLAFLLGFWSAQQTLNIQQSHKHIRNLGLTELPRLYGLQAHTTHVACNQGAIGLPLPQAKTKISHFPGSTLGSTLPSWHFSLLTRSRIRCHDALLISNSGSR